MKGDVRYRYVTPTTTGRWRGTMEEARFAAAKAGFGSIDEYNGRVYLAVMVTIEGDDGSIRR